ncbi:MAG TPA: hypothetical protein VI248_01185 [Kineosporiaceae bacterium]
MTDPHGAAGHDGRQGHDQGVRGDGGDLVEVPEAPPVTGDQIVDDAVSSLRCVTAVPVQDQPGIFDSVHRTLQDRLADVEG